MKEDIERLSALGYSYRQIEKELEPRFLDSGFCGFFPPDGWLDLVVELHRKLLPNPNYRIAQVKEKFGGLRFYVDGLTDAEQELVDAAEQESYGICQQCGSRDDVEMRNYGWYATLCAACSGAKLLGLGTALWDMVEDYYAPNWP